MQCASCKFENMPGTELCGRCGTSMRLATAVIDVHPPRAGRFRLGARRALALDAARGKVARPLRTAWEGAGVGSPILAELALMLRGVVPGWPQARLGQRLRSRVLFIAWLALLLWGLLMFGTFFGSMLLGLAMAVHGAAVVDVLTRGASPRPRPERALMGVAAVVALLTFLYAPAGRLLTRYADPVTITEDAGPFRAGDVLLVNHAATASRGPRPGEVVLFNTGQFQTGTYQQGGVIFAEGQRIDRVLAGPGDTVQWSAGTLRVNGVASDLRPLLPERLPGALSVRVPEGKWLILPTLPPGPRPNDAASTWLSMALVSREDVVGTVYLRKHPLAHMKVIH